MAVAEKQGIPAFHLMFQFTVPGVKNPKYKLSDISLIRGFAPTTVTSNSIILVEITH